MINAGNLFADIAARAREEQFATLLETPAARIERIVSAGHCSPPGFWYDQPSTEWVVLVSGKAALRFETESEPRVLSPGDWLEIPPHARHRLEWTDADRPTVWLAVHVNV